MIVSFDSEIAKEYGVNCAIILNYLQFWVGVNRESGKHLYEGRYWTYNSVKAFSGIFDFMSKKQIRKAIDTLIEEGLVIDGNFNDIAFDRTKWYTLTDKGMKVATRDDSICPTGQITFAPEGKPIPVNNTVNNINNIRDSKESLCQTGENPVRQVERAWNSLAEYGVPKINKMSTTSTRCKMLNARISEYGLNEVLRTVDMIKDCDFLLGRSSSGWLISFDWFVKPNNFPKVNEGKYLNRTPMSSAPAVQTMRDEYEGYQ